MKILILFFLSLMISACQSSKTNAALPFTPAKLLNDKNPPPVSPYYQLINAADPLLSKAFQDYQKTGVAKAIETEQFIQFPYSIGEQPIINASILELTAISLEQGEQVNSVSSGDPLRWSYSLVYSGIGDLKQAHILVKPAKPHISTDFFITTDKRAYILKLVSQVDGKTMRNVRFWYPETLSEQIQKATSSLIAQMPTVDLNHLNFKYEIRELKSAYLWTPQRIFDDGVHTYIQFPPSVASNDLPALFVENDQRQELVNYRVKAPYFIVDRIFQKAILVNGVGKHQQTINIVNLAVKGE